MKNNQSRGPIALPNELHERTSAIAATYFELEQSRKAVDAKGKIEIKTCKVCNFTMTCETESDLRSWRFHTHSHVSEKRSSLFAVECNCPGRQFKSTFGRFFFPYFCTLFDTVSTSMGVPRESSL